MVSFISPNHVALMLGCWVYEVCLEVPDLFARSLLSALFFLLFGSGSYILDEVGELAEFECFLDLHLEAITVVGVMADVFVVCAVKASVHIFSASHSFGSAELHFFGEEHLGRYLGQGRPVLTSAGRVPLVVRLLIPSWLRASPEAEYFPSEVDPEMQVQTDCLFLLLLELLPRLLLLLFRCGWRNAFSNWAKIFVVLMTSSQASGMPSLPVRHL